MMNFRILKDNLVTILGDAVAVGGDYEGLFTVVGYQQQGVGASEVLGNNRRVQVFFKTAEFGKGEAGITGETTTADEGFAVRLTTSAAAKGDLTVINNQNSTAAELAAAIADFQVASEVADADWDELADMVYQILMDGRNLDIGTSGPHYIVGSRWVSGISKDEPLNAGEYVALTGDITFDCTAEESIVGDTGTPAGSGAFDQTLDIIGDDNEKTGATV